MDEDKDDLLIKGKFGRIFEVIVIVLMLADLILLSSLFFFNPSPEIYNIIVYFDLIVVLILIPEFLYRFWKAEDKKKFMWNNWTDILGMIPEIVLGPVSTVFRYFRLIRLIKIVALFKKEIHHILEFLHETKIDYGVLFLLIVLLCSATILYFVEIGINDNINTYDDAFWYLLVTVTTVGYGDVYPKTGIGRIIGTTIMFTGIGFMSFLTATITYALLNKEDKLNKMNCKLDKIDSEINELKEIMKNNK